MKKQMPVTRKKQKPKQKPPIVNFKANRTNKFRFAVVLVIAAVGTYMVTMSLAATTYTTAQWNTALDSKIHSDDAQSVKLPNGKILWTFGDTLSVNGKSSIGSLGYPHSAFMTQSAGTLNFTPVAGKYGGYGWQQVPNWSDHTYFWMATPVVDKGVLYVIGQRIKGVVPFSVVGSYVAEFNANTLAFEKVVAIPNGSSGHTNWGGITMGASGWWISGTHNVSCSNATDCKVGDLAWVPFGKLADASAWQLHNNVIPATDNIGTTLGLVKTSTGWDIFTKTGDAYGGSTIERLQATSITGPWTVNGSWPIIGPSGTVTYGVAVHPEQTAPAGDVLVTYNVNNSKSICWPLTAYLPE
jgi:hypothetical protein